MAIWRMRIACWIPKATNTHSEYVILTAFPLPTVVTRKRLNVTFVLNLPVLFKAVCIRCKTVRPSGAAVFVRLGCVGRPCASSKP